MGTLKDVTIGQLLKDAVIKYGKKEAIVYSNENIRYTYMNYTKQLQILQRLL